MEDLFIECVKKHPCLWKTDMNEYKMNEVKDEAWKNVIEESEASENGIKTVKEAKYLWKKLRDMHRQSVSRKLKDKSRNNYKKWKHEDQMGFLLPYLKRQSFEHINVTTDSDYMQDDIEIEVPDDESDSTIPKQPRKRENITIYVNEHKIENRAMERDLSISGNQDDMRQMDFSTRPALDSFFTSMCEMTSALPEHIQISVERKIFDVVMEAREEHLQNQMSYYGT